MKSEAIKQINEEILKLLEGCNKTRGNPFDWECGDYNLIPSVTPTKDDKKYYCNECRHKLKTWLTALKGELYFLNYEHDMYLSLDYNKIEIDMSFWEERLSQRILNIKETVKAIEGVLNT